MFESYSIVMGADESILRLNDVLEHCEFVKVSLEELERNFGDLFNLPNSFSSKGPVIFEDGQRLSVEFYSIITSGNTFVNLVDISMGYCIMLRGELGAIDGHMTHHVNIQPILQALRLTAPGHIGIPITFSIKRPSNHISGKLTHSSQGIQRRGLFTIKDEQQIKDFRTVLQKIPPDEKNFRLAFSAFNNSYNMFDYESDFIMCVTALESIFNHTKDQISHTIARHLSVLISLNICEFKDNYRKIKKLYNQRSNLVHGASDEISEEDSMAANELVRRALRFCLDKDFTRESLFEYCNSRGFSGMEFRPIKTETDYQNALAEIQMLFDVAPNTAEYDRLDILATLVEAYEKKHYPIDLPDPIAAIE
jgi:hypothetical protein